MAISVCVVSMAEFFGRGLRSLSTRATDLSGEVPRSPFTLPDVSKPTAIVYVDGFNLYRRTLKGTPYKWLDLVALSSALLYEYDVILVRYFTKKADVFIILTNDSDLAEPLCLAKNELGQTVGLILPTDTPSSELLKVDPQIFRQIREGALTISQLPKDFYDRHGTITKPESW